MSFTYSDKELELLLDVILHYKADKEGRGFDWQSVKMKYEDLKAMFIESSHKQSKLPSKNLKQRTHTFFRNAVSSRQWLD